MYGFHFIQMTSLIGAVVFVDGQALYENKCINHEHYDGYDLLHTQVNNFKNQLDTLSDTTAFLQFQLRCLSEKGTYEEQTVTRNQYCIMKSTSTWIDGKTKCQSLGGYPLEIETYSEQTWINGKISGLVGKWWIGVVLDTVKNVWVWDHSGNTLTFTNWWPGEPGGKGSEKCVMMENDGTWHDYPCTHVFNIICERK